MGPQISRFSKHELFNADLIIQEFKDWYASLQKTEEVSKATFKITVTKSAIISDDKKLITKSLQKTISHETAGEVSDDDLSQIKGIKKLLKNALDFTVEIDAKVFAPLRIGHKVFKYSNESFLKAKSDK